MRLAFVAIVLFASAAAAATVELPLGGYYRPGRCFPLRVRSDNAAAIEVRGAGVVPVRVSDTFDAIVPAVPITEPSGRFSVNQQRVLHPLKKLGPKERLVGVVGAVAEIPRELFAQDVTLIKVTLDAHQPLPGPASAWEALDAVVMEGGRPPTVGRDTIGALLGRGVIWAVHSPASPDEHFPAEEHWPWQREGGWWVLRHDPPGPSSPIVPSAYADANFASGLPVAQRRGVLFVAAFASIAMLGVTLLPRRFVLPALLVTVLLACAATYTWAATQQNFSTMFGAIVIQEGTLNQADEWTFISALRDGEYSSQWSTAGIRPILASADAPDVLLECYDRQMRLRAKLKRGERLVTLTRYSYNERRSWNVASVARSPMLSIARECYIRPDIRIAGEEPPRGADYRRWPSVFVERIKR